MLLKKQNYPQFEKNHSAFFVESFAFRFNNASTEYTLIKKYRWYIKCTIPTITYHRGNIGLTIRASDFGMLLQR
jgi:hypothetical protein